MNNNTDYSSDYPTKERMIEIMKLMLKYITEGEVAGYSDPLVGISSYSLRVKGRIVGGFCSLLKDMIYLHKDITVLEEDVVLELLKQELAKIRGINSPMILGSYWFPAMCFSADEDEVTKGKRNRIEFLQTTINRVEYTNKLSNNT